MPKVDVQEKAKPQEVVSFGIRKEFDDLENFLFGIKEPGAMTAFKTLTHIRARCYKMGMQVYGE